LARDSKAHAEVIQRVREENRAAYYKGMLSRIQKDLTLEGHITQAAALKQFLTSNKGFPIASYKRE
jgi:hypothetical protein